MCVFMQFIVSKSSEYYVYTLRVLAKHVRLPFAYVTDGPEHALTEV